MRVAWVTHHLPKQAMSSWELPGGLVGGAEMTDAAMISKAPENYTVTLHAPHEWREALNADRIVITGTDLLTPEAMTELGKRRPLVWVHHAQEPSSFRQRLFLAAQPFVTMSQSHAIVEQAWSHVKSLWCHGHIDLQEISPQPKTMQALWAARNHPQKGVISARIWARRNGVRLTEITNAPRHTVLQAMAIHKTFVFLPKGFDSCPRTLIEAEAAGCEIVTNSNAGRRDQGDLHEVMADQAEKFWSWV